jgi:hypothetical protein
MARKITTDAIEAFMSGKKFNRDNTNVRLENETWILSLHGNDIAERVTYSRPVRISNGGWSSNTTKERLNGIPGVSIVQRKGVWYLNGEEWDGGWKKI